MRNIAGILIESVGRVNLNSVRITAYPEVPTESSSEGAKARPIPSQEFGTASKTRTQAIGLK